MSVDENNAPNSVSNNDTQDDAQAVTFESAPEHVRTEAPARHDAAPAKKGGSFLRWLMFLVFLAALAAIAWWWTQNRGGEITLGANNQASLQADASTNAPTMAADANSAAAQNSNAATQENSSTRSSAASALVSDVRDLQTQLDRTLEDASDKLSSATQRIDHNDRRQKMLSDELIGLRERLVHLESSVARLAEQSIQAETSIKLDQLESTLMMGEERYRMYADRAAAARALGLADELIGTLDGVRFNSLRQTLAGERAALEATPEDPRTQMGSGLMELREQVAYLPTLQGDEVKLADEADPAFVRKLAGLVTIRRQTDGVSSLSEGQKDASLAVIQMNLSRAQLALSLDNESGFKDALSEVKNAVTHTFVQDDKKTQAALEKINGLLNQTMRTDIPALGSTLAELRRIRALNAIRATPAEPASAAPVAPKAEPKPAPEPVAPAPTPAPAVDGDSA